MVINQMVSLWLWMILKIERKTWKTISLYGDHGFPDLSFLSIHGHIRFAHGRNRIHPWGSMILTPMILAWHRFFEDRPVPPFLRSGIA
jgi:hypothetical protein